MTIDPGAVIGPRAEIGAGTVIGAGAVIGPGVRIGRDCAIGPARLDHPRLDRRPRHRPSRHAASARTASATCMGAKGHRKVPQIGRVIIQDDVEIGANTTIDRGAMRDTVIGEGTKIDNLVQIGHNTSDRPPLRGGRADRHLGQRDARRFRGAGGRRGVEDHVTIGEGAQIGAVSSVYNDVPAGARWAGIRAKPVRRMDARDGEPRAAGRARSAAKADRPKSDGVRTDRWTKRATTLEAADIATILKALPHRYPFLMVDRIINMRGDESAVGIKNVTVERAAVPRAFSRQSGVSRRAADRRHGADRGRALRAVADSAASGPSTSTSSPSTRRSSASRSCPATRSNIT